MAIDRADWHYGGDFPEGLPIEAGGTHIGFFLYWIITNDHLGLDHTEDDFSEEIIQAVKSGQRTGRDFLFDACDEKFWDDDCSEEVLPFVKDYYVDGEYLNDISGLFDQDFESVYHVPDTIENAQRVSALISEKYSQWKSNK